MTGDHDHRPDPAAMLAALDLADAIYADDKPGIRQAVSGAACPACVAIAAMSLGINVAEQLAAELVAKLAPGAVLDARPIRAAILDVIGRFRRELRSAGN